MYIQLLTGSECDNFYKQNVSIDINMNMWAGDMKIDPITDIHLK